MTIFLLEFQSLNFSASSNIFIIFLTRFPTVLKILVMFAYDVQTTSTIQNLTFTRTKVIITRESEVKDESTHCFGKIMLYIHFSSLN